ncbi:MAG TPA: hypothetical protein VIR29_08155 [Anseongella sp.]
MERIVIEVDSSLAQAWRKVPASLRQQFEKDMEAQLAEKIRLAEIDNFEQALHNLRTQAAENGLTQEILEKILSEED